MRSNQVVDYPFTLRVVSPAFNGGAPAGTRTVSRLTGKNGGQEVQTVQAPYHPADPRGIRIPSLRGVLAFWHRACCGGLDAPLVFAQQGAIFGSLDAGRGLAIRPAGRPRLDPGPLVFPGVDQAMLYLGFGPLLLLKDPVTQRSAVTSHNHKAVRDAIRVGPKGEVAAIGFVARCTEHQRVELERALRLLHLFGGIGSRSRRGWGSLEVEAPCIEAYGGGEPVPWIERSFARALRGGDGEAALLGTRPTFSAFSSGTRVVATPHLAGGYEAVLRELFRRFGEVRLWGRGTSPPPIAVRDHALEQADAGGTAITGVPERLAFGMPYQPASRRNRWSIEYGSVDGSGAEDPNTRRASPLFLKVHRAPDGRHFGVALFLEAAFFGDPARRITARQKTGSQPPPGYGAVHAYLDCPRWRQVDLTRTLETAT